MRQTFLIWLRGLLAAFIGAAAQTVTVTVVDPVAFNFGAQWRKTVTVALVGGVFAAAGYLAKSPLPSTPIGAASSSSSSLLSHLVQPSHSAGTDPGSDSQPNSNPEGK